jgi:uncharacterized surface protein with fasciclin (FAS1) repeats
MQRKTVSLLVALLLFSAIPLNVSADENDDIPTNASSTGVHDSLVAALTHADLVSTLQGDGPFTVFAPTDDAFAAAGIDLTSFDTDEENATLADILLYHVYSGAVNAADVTDGMTVAMVNGDDASFTVSSDGTVMIGDATVTTADVISSNGVIHVIDTVLMPPADLVDIPSVAVGTGVHTALVAALTKADLVSTLQGDGPFTVFAPTDQAFTDAGIDLDSFSTDEEIATLADILTYHVVAGSVLSTDLEDKTTTTAVNGDSLAFAVDADGVMVNDANVVSADVLASNGVVHVIDKVLMPPIEIEPDIPTVAARTGVHTALVAALTQADLVTTLQGDGPFTVFAPTDDAFAAAGIDLTTFDTDEEIAALVDILLFHVYSGAVNAADVTDGLTVTMVNGDEATFTVSTDGTVMVGDATVTSADVIASNGVIHVIDEVLMPPADLGDIPTVAAGTEIHTSLVAAVVQAGLLETLQSEGPFTLFAPTDEAFAAAGIDLAALDTPEGKETLANILLYHVVPGKIMSADLTDGKSNVTTANGDLLLVYVSDVLGVMVGDGVAMVTLADVPASNGVIHVIDKVLTPPADNDVTCDVTIGISSDGYAFSPAAVTIDVNQTVCWSWTSESMAHNVKEVDGMKSTTFVDGGITSGEASMTVDFHHTFTEDTIFYYACEPHISVDMFGKITVGDGGVEPSSDDDDDSENNTPGFLGVTMIIATLGAVLFARSNRDEE